MPIFEYVCNECNSSFETIVIGSTEPECPSCHSKQLAQRFSVFTLTAKSPAPAAAQPMGGCCGGGACGLPGPCDN